MPLCCASPSRHLYMGPILYDELARKQWAARAAKSDPTLNILKEATNPAADLVAAALSRISTILQGAGLSADAPAVISPVPTGDVSLSSQLAPQVQATNAWYRRTHEASSAMVEEDERLRDREEALAGQGLGRKGLL